MSAAWGANLPATPKLVLLALADNANDEGNCAPSMNRIAQKCSLTERAVLNNINLLELGGFILRENRQFKSNVYLITTPNTWQTERAKPSKQRQKQRAETGHTEPDSVRTELDSYTELNSVRTEPDSATNITIKSTTIGIGRTHDVPPATLANRETEQAYPAWLDVEAFEEFRAHRVAIKKPLNAQSEKLAIIALGIINGKNTESQRDVIERSILNGWAGLFPKNNKMQNKMQNKPKFNAFDFLTNGGIKNEIDITGQ
jgi:hypothetical protein